MLPSLGFSEMLLLAVLALVVIGPKDLPLMMRKLGQWTARLRGMAQEFRAGFDELARQAELDELRKEVDALRQSATEIRNEITRPMEYKKPAVLPGTLAPVEDTPPVPDIAAPVSEPAPIETPLHTEPAPVRSAS